MLLANLRYPGDTGNLLANRGVSHRTVETGSHLSVGIIGALQDWHRKHGIQSAYFWKRSIRSGADAGPWGGVVAIPTGFQDKSLGAAAELIDGQHHTLINYAHEFGLELEDLCNEPSRRFRFCFKGTHYSRIGSVEGLSGFCFRPCTTRHHSTVSP
jgi:hypothetical protein